uniref:Ubiquitin carboxyl-terminal hydrolase n=1 Tax=Steinernema glaseri TaxID=37863 RepID=A0A1I7YHJ4_9BILA
MSAAVLREPSNEGIEVNEALFAGCCTATEGSKVYKDECMFCFHSPFHTGGILICLKTHMGFCARHVVEYSKKSGARCFLKRQKCRLPNEVQEPINKITKLAIGVEGGFKEPSDEVQEKYSLFVYPETEIELGDRRVTSVVREICDSVAANSGALLEDKCRSFEVQRKVTKFANIEQLPSMGKVIPPSGWVCEEEGCGLKENLWLNLADGTIYCGRQQMLSENTVAVGNGHMRTHYELTHMKYPLVVKLGTIENGDADVYSYAAAEDDAVIDPNLVKHLAHWGIDALTAKKTEKSTLEMELDLNRDWEWERCQENGVLLESVYGPGLTPMINIGSSCYINSAIQMLLQIPDISERYEKHYVDIFEKIGIPRTQEDFDAQMAKLVVALQSGDYSKDGSDLNGIKPFQFRRVAGRDHAEFSTGKQQDVEEYLRLLLTKMDESEYLPNPVNAVRFKLERRFEDIASSQVRYGDKEEFILSLNMPEELASDVRDETGVLRKQIPLSVCLESTFADSMIEDFKSPVTGELKGARERIRMKTFPKYLFVQMKKFGFAKNANGSFDVKKLDIEVVLDEKLDLQSIRGSGVAPHEHLLPEDQSIVEDQSTAVEEQFKQEILDGCLSMGFSDAFCRKAIRATDNSTLEAALDWILQHPEEDNANNEQQSTSAGKGVDQRVEKLAEELSKTFDISIEKVRYALKINGNVADNAVNWLFMNPLAEIPKEVEQAPTEQKVAVPKSFDDGKGSYSLVGMISHMGANTHSGHYVVHLKRGDKWILFNDEKVNVSQKTPFGLGYIYLYKRDQ